MSVRLLDDLRQGLIVRRLVGRKFGSRRRPIAGPFGWTSVERCTRAVTHDIGNVSCHGRFRRPSDGRRVTPHTKVVAGSLPALDGTLGVCGEATAQLFEMSDPGHRLAKRDLRAGITGISRRRTDRHG